MRRRIGWGCYFGVLTGIAVTVCAIGLAISVMSGEQLVSTAGLLSRLNWLCLAALPLWGVGGGVIAYLTRRPPEKSQ